MGASRSAMSKNKSLLRSGSGYPYPRSHTPLVVVPSSRPQAPDEKHRQEPPQQKQQLVQPRRRPPLNRACPPIPESKSNESIMSHASRVSVSKEATSDCVVIENPQAIGIRESAMQRTASTSRDSSATPRSPLMTVAHSVRAKLSKLTQRKSHGSSMRGSKSFCGTRAQPAAPLRRVDENANRVVKSSSMDTPLASGAHVLPTKVVIPVNPEPLVVSPTEDHAESIMEQSAAMSPTVSTTITTVTETVTTRTTSANSPPISTSSPPRTSPSPPKMVIVTHTVVERPLSVTYTSGSAKSPPMISPPDRTVNFSEDVMQREYTPSDQLSLSQQEDLVPEKVVEEIIVEDLHSDKENMAKTEAIIDEKLEKKLEARIRSSSMSPERYVLRTSTSIEDSQSSGFFVVSQRKNEPKKPEQPKEEPPKTPATPKKKPKDTKVELVDEPAQRYVMTVRTPEPLRKHKVLCVGEGEPKPKPSAMKRSRSEERQTSKFLQSLKRPLSLKRHNTFSSTPRPPTPPSPPKQQKYVLVTKTPQFLRRHHTFMVGERAPSPDVPWIEDGQLTEPIATVGPLAKARARTRSEEPRKPPEPRYIMTTRTPIAMRKFQTFVVENKGDEPKMIPTSASAPTAFEERRGDKLLRELEEAQLLKKTPSFMSSGPVEEHLDPLPADYVDKYNYEKIVSSPIEEPLQPATAQDMYMLTTMTPLPKRKAEVKPNPSSPERPSLFMIHPPRPQYDLRLDTLKERSQSDVAERSHVSGDITSPEEDIPMDTQLTPSDNVIDTNVVEVVLRPVETPASPPRPVQLHVLQKSTEVVTKKLEPKQQKSAGRSLREAGSALFRHKKHKKVQPTPKQPVAPSPPTRRAPLAESEPTTVADSPLVECQPIPTSTVTRTSIMSRVVEKRNSIIQEEEHDANGNVTEPRCPSPPAPGLIDDEILDQPMLVYGSFPDSPATDVVMVDASFAEELPRRTSPAATSRSEEVVTARVEPLPKGELEDGLQQVAKLRETLYELNRVVTRSSEDWERERLALIAENDQLRRQLAERDQLINSLRNQLAAAKAS